jgi:hypothetical protein
MQTGPVLRLWQLILLQVEGKGGGIMGQGGRVAWRELTKKGM